MYLRQDRFDERRPVLAGALGQLGDAFGLVQAGASTAKTEVITVVAKSYIAPIGSNVGSVPCIMSPLAPVPVPSAVALRALAAVTQAASNDKSDTAAVDKRYRLFSARSFTVTSGGGKLIRIAPSPSVLTDVGLECLPGIPACLTPPALKVVGATVKQTGPSTFAFSWAALGRPHAAAEPGFQAVCPRTSRYIWHRVTGTIDVSGPTKVIATLTGSRFPSHRIFVNGALRQTIPQGPFGYLWVPRTPGSPIVR